MAFRCWTSVSPRNGFGVVKMETNGEDVTTARPLVRLYQFVQCSVTSHRHELPAVTATWLFRSTTFNFAATLVPGIVGIFAVPPAVHGLGPERFGVLSLAA